MKGIFPINRATEYGFHFPGARAWIDTENVSKTVHDANMVARRMARDSFAQPDGYGPMVTVSNTTVPFELLAYIDPTVIEILTAPENARELFAETKRGDWTTPYMKWRYMEYTGAVQEYFDYTANLVSKPNPTWATREQYRFQTVIQYGDLETDMTAEVKIAWASENQTAAAMKLDMMANRYYLFGVEDREVYGLLNDPNLPDAVQAPNGASGSAEWATKTTVEIYNDILFLLQQLVLQSNGWINAKTPLILAISPALSVRLGAATDFNVSVQDMIDKYFSNLKIVVLPELGDNNSGAGETAIMFAPSVKGKPTGWLAYGEKLRAHRIVPELSALKQKWTSTTYGGIILQDFAFARLIGI